MVALNTIFRIGYGSQLDLNKCQLCQRPQGYNFVNRSAANCGVSARILAPENVEPHKAGLITSAMGGSVLATFVQQEDFFTGQNVKVLEPLEPMTLNEKLFFCACIEANRFRFSAFGREANASFDTMMVPARHEVPDYIQSFSMTAYTDVLETSEDMTHANDISDFASDDPQLDMLGNIFYVENGVEAAALDRRDTKETSDFLPIIRPSYKQETSIDAFVHRSEVPANKIFPKGSLYVSTNGQGSHTYAYVSATEFVPNSDVAVLIRKDGREMTLKEKLFYAYCISFNRFKFSYGRKPKGDKLKSILLPREIPSLFNEADIDRFVKLNYS
jgi:hypothetical protein